MDNYALVVKIKKNSMKILFLLLTNKEIAKTMNVLNIPVYYSLLTLV